MPRLKALALIHVAFEDLGSLHTVLQQKGFLIEYAEATAIPFPGAAIQDADLLVVLGGPIGVYDVREYPFLESELSALRQRLAARKPTLGICLGAQLIASALGARVYPGSSGAEIGWSALTAPEDVSIPSWFKNLLAPGVEVLHWHGDTFDLPEKAQHLASTHLYSNQAFMLGNFALALQFHPEVTAEGLERWYVGHTCELHGKGIDVAALRKQGQLKSPALLAASRLFWNGWLNYIL
jgi:GMP synthase (glutamine-hydrolysing)